MYRLRTKGESVWPLRIQFSELQRRVCYESLSGPSPLGFSITCDRLNNSDTTSFENIVG